MRPSRRAPILLALSFAALQLSLPPSRAADPPPAAAKPVPRLQVLPQPYDQAAFIRGDDDVEVARYHFGPALRRPFVFPLLGPAGRGLTRMGHPHDPQTHSHHNSIWIAHNSVNGVSFWDDHGKGRIAHQRVDAYEDLGDTSYVAVTNHWLDEGNADKVLLVERRRTTIELLPNRELLLTLDLQLEAPPGAPVTLGKTPFGLVGVRMAKTIGVNDGGGEIRNSAGKSGEKDLLWQPAKWCDCSGPIRENVVEGIMLMDHPANPNHPTAFHVRGDGWMGASLTQAAERVIEPGKPLPPPLRPLRPRRQTHPRATRSPLVHICKVRPPRFESAQEEVVVAWAARPCFPRKRLFMSTPT